MSVHNYYIARMDITLGRTAHLLDVENLVGTGRFGASEAQSCRSAYTALGLLNGGDHVIVACNPFSAIHVLDLWPGTRLLTGHGRDGADLALLAAIENEHFEDRFDRIVVGSGDGIFTDAVASFRQTGREVVVVGRQGAIAQRLRFAAGRSVVELPPMNSPIPPTSEQLLKVA
jgi:hypothetical protein